MKKELSNIEGFISYCCLEPVEHPAGYYSLNFSSQWTSAKDPNAEQTRFTTFLSPEALNNLRDLIK